MKSAYQRTDRVADAIKREIADVLSRDVKDPRLEFVTITDVQVTRDLKQARVFFTTMREGEAFTALVDGLHHAAGYVQRKLGSRLKLRNTPHISFEYDSSIEHGVRMNTILKTIEEELDAHKE
jgi:ribosome-binding factor A